MQRRTRKNKKKFGTESKQLQIEIDPIIMPRSAVDDVSEALNQK